MCVFYPISLSMSSARDRDNLPQCLRFMSTNVQQDPAPAGTPDFFDSNSHLDSFCTAVPAWSAPALAAALAPLTRTAHIVS